MNTVAPLALRASSPSCFLSFSPKGNLFDVFRPAGLGYIADGISGTLSCWQRIGPFSQNCCIYPYTLCPLTYALSGKENSTSTDFVNRRYFRIIARF